MVRIFLVLLIVGAPASAGEWWHDVARGCGESVSWTLSKRIADLPGCDGELPKGAPAGEVAMHDAKLKLHQAERLLDAKTSVGVDTLLTEATAAWAKAPVADARVQWAKARYDQASELLKERFAAAAKEAGPAPKK